LSCSRLETGIEMNTDNSHDAPLTMAFSSLPAGFQPFPRGRVL
jgi:hypothetical protein